MKSSQRTDYIQLFLDSTEIIGRKFRLDGAHMAVLERAIRLGKVKLFVPRVVVDEVCNKYGEELSKKNRTALDALREIDILLNKAGRRAIEVVDIPAALHDFRSRLETRLAELQAEQPSYDDISHRDVIRRDLERRRPFQDSGKGYRDALIWETILRTVANDKLTILITDNKKDFCEDQTASPEYQLHRHLVDDLKAKSLAPGCIRVFPSLESFINREGKTLLPTNAELVRAIKNNEYSLFSFEDFFRQHRDEIGTKLEGQINESNLLTASRVEIESPSVQYVEDPERVQLRDARILDEGKLFLVYDVLTDVNVDFFVFKSDYYAMGDDEEDFEIEDSDWNDHYILASKLATLPIQVSVVFEIKSYEVEEFDVEVIEFFGSCWKCNNPIMSDAAETCPSCGANLLRRASSRQKASTESERSS